ncbi:TPA: integrase core domain-containing protein [Neisseria elongata]
MYRYILHRLLLLIPTLLGILAITFVVIQFVPGGPVEQMVQQLTYGAVSGETANATAGNIMKNGNRISPEDLAALNALYGFDKPPLTRFADMVWRFARFDLGELYAAILPDKTADSAAKFLTEHLIDPCPYLIECVYSDNGTEYKGSANHAFGVACYKYGIGQKFTRVARPQTNGKAERVIRTLMEMWHEKQSFDSPEHRQKELCRFVNFYNTVKPHCSLNGDTPFEVLQAYFSQPVV